MPRIQNEMIAITGIGLRFPGGAEDAQSFWELLCQRKNGIVEIPNDRWSTSSFYDPIPGKPCRTYSRWGGFIKDIDKFDAEFFKISPQEAESMDPQQRLLLEATWHAIEDAGERIDRKNGENIGVYIGISTNDYANIGSAPEDFSPVSAFSATGGAVSVAANRISHALNFTGPSLAVDTACSSSLTALHLACASLWRQECDRAIVGGVNLILNPSTWVAFSGMSALSKDGLCKAFDASADGFVRSEGVGVVLIKPLSQAVKNGDRVYACIRSVGVNQDGRTPGIAVPDQNAHEQLIKDTCARAGLLPSQIDFVEAHGTGTAVGDPIEGNGLGLVLGAGRPPDRPLVVGACKTNIGHLESASGIASLIKTALVLRHRTVPPNLHFQNPNPAIDFDKLNLKIPTDTLHLPPDKHPLYAGINSFGFGGANAHAILQSAPAPDIQKHEAQNQTKPSQSMLPLSAQSDDSLRSLAQGYRSLLKNPGIGFQKLCATAALKRNPLKKRLTISGKTTQELESGLAAYLKGETHPGLHTGTASNDHLDTAFVFSGQGAQWPGMGRELYRSHVPFKNVIKRCHDMIRQLGGFSLIDEILLESSESNLHRTEIAQPAIFALQVALVETWRSLGIEPAAVIGHSVGEVAAAHVAGILSLEDAVRTIYYRGYCMKDAPGGKMVAVGVSPRAALEIIQEHGGQLSLAAINSSSSVTISGESGPIQRIFDYFNQAGVFCRYVPVEYAFHSEQMDPVRENLLDCLKNIQPEKSKIPFYSTVSGTLAADLPLDAAYWWKNVRQTVQFAPAIDEMIAAGLFCFLEINAHPVLGPSITQCLKTQENNRGIVLPSLKRKVDDWESMTGTAGRIFCAGARIEWERINGKPEVDIDLPFYPFRRKSYWRMSPFWKDSWTQPVSHPFLFRRQKSPEPVWHFWPDGKLFPYFNDHSVQQRLVFPGSGYVEMALAMAMEIWKSPGSIILEEIEFKRALFLPETEIPVLVRGTVDLKTSIFNIYSSLDEHRKNWTLHATGYLRHSKKSDSFSSKKSVAVRSNCREETEIERFYQLLAQNGLQYGPLFRGLHEIRRGEKQAWGRIALPAGLQDAHDDYYLHPVILDAAFQLTFATLPSDGYKDEMNGFMPVWIDRLHFFKKPGVKIQACTQMRSLDQQKMDADILIADHKGMPIAKISGFRSRKLIQPNTQKYRGVSCHFTETQWDLSPLEGKPADSSPTGFFPNLNRFCVRLQDTIETIDRDLHLSRHLSKLADLERRIVPYYILTALTDLGCNLESGETITFSEIVRKTGISKSRHPLLKRFLWILTKTNVLRYARPDSWEVTGSFRIRGMKDSFRQWIKDIPGSLLELQLCILCGESLSRVLKGQMDPLTLLFQPEAAHLLEHFFSTSTSFRASNHAIREVMVALAKRLPMGRKLKILEIGAGTGGSTEVYLPELPDGHYEVLFTDVSEGFFKNARDKFQDYPDVEYRQLDISLPPSQQNFFPIYDVVVATDVIHATPYLKQTLNNIHQLLRPGGWFVMVETDRPPLFADLVFGLTDGWWQFKDSDLRPNYPLLPRKEWLDLLPLCGFENINVVSEPAGGSTPYNGIYLMRQPEPATGANPIITKTENERAEIPLKSETVPFDPISTRRFLIFKDRCGVGEQIGEYLLLSGHRVTYLESEEWTDDFQFHLSKSNQLSDLDGIIYLWGLDIPVKNDFTAGDLQNWQKWLAHVPVNIAQTLATLSETSGGNFTLWMVTRGATAIQPAEMVDCAQSSLQGLGRVVFSGVRNLRSRLIDISTQVDPVEIELLSREILGGSDEDQVTFRGEGRYVPRIRYTSPESQQTLHRESIHRTPCRLTSQKWGVLDHLFLEQIQRRTPAADEMEVEVSAAGMNFRDVLKALKIYSTDAPDARILGDEFAGVVLRTGSDVSTFSPGDRVFGIWRNTIRSHLTLPSNVVCPLPESMTFNEGTTFTIAFLTAYYALHTIGHIKTGERLLIHSGAGGVGMAAVQLGLKEGAEIFATAGDPLKRTFLKRLGVHHVFDSRSPEFAAEIMDVTGGEGVDLVLNSLAGEMIQKSLSCLRDGGRFLEIGKRDIIENNRISLRPFRKELLYASIDIARHMNRKELPGLAEKLTALLKDQVITPLPYLTFPLDQATRAFRFMTQGKHIGKIVLSLNHQRAKPKPVILDKIELFREDRTFLITGGTRGFGLVIARWLCDRDVRHLVLVGCSGKTNEELEETVGELKELGVDVNVRFADVGSERKIRPIIEEIRATMPPLGGIFHAAVVYADEVFMKMTPDKFDEATHPKMSGAWNLHHLTLDDPVEFFVMFSSMSTFFANPTQANYVAANYFLEALAHYRRNLDLPALTVSWDRFSDSGHVARNQQLGDYLERFGWGGIGNEETLRALEILLANKTVHMGVSNFDFGKWSEAVPQLASTPRFQDVLANEIDIGAEEQSRNIRREFFFTAPEKRLEKIEAFLTEQIARVLHVSPQRISSTLPLDQQGFDSLMAVELLARVEGRLGVPIPTGQMMDGPTILKLSKLLLELLTGQESSIQQTVGHESPDQTSRKPETGSPLNLRPRLPEGCGPAEDLVQLKEALSEMPMLPPQENPPNDAAHLFVTGATGLLGSHIVNEIINTTNAVLYCLIRADSANSAGKRLAAALAHYRHDIPDLLKAERIHALPGDLARDRLGLSKGDYSTVLDKVDAIFHLGAHVNHLSSYHQLRRVNILGTLEAMKLAWAGRRKTFHFASSVAVFSPNLSQGRLDRLESQPPDELSSLTGGYGQSKAVCEHLLHFASNNGLKVIIYRIGPLIGNNGFTQSQPSDVISLIVKTCLEAGVAPQNDLNLYLTPVELVGQVLFTGLFDIGPGQVYHVINTAPTSFNDLFNVARDMGYVVDRVEPKAWISTIRTSNRSYPFLPYVVFAEEQLEDAVRYQYLPKLDHRQLDRLFQNMSLTEASLDRKCLELYFKSLINCGFIPPPGTAGKNAV